MKQRKMILILESNYEEAIEEVLRHPEIDYLAVTAFYRLPLEKGWPFLQRLKRIFPAEDIILISDVAYLANDLEIGAVLEFRDLKSFNLPNFMEVYENSISHYPDVAAFFSSVSDLYSFTFNMYEKEGAWFFVLEKHGVLLINDKNYHKILKNYHKIKRHTSDLAFINLNETGVERNLKLLKMLGSDAHISFGVTNHLKSKFSQRIDVIIHMRSPYYEEKIQNFCVNFFSEHSWDEALDVFQSFLEIEPKSFEADLWDDVEEVIKEEKRCFLRRQANEEGLRKYQIHGHRLFYPQDREDLYCLEKDLEFKNILKD